MSDGLGPWADRLLPASWRGIPFAVVESRIERGRRTASHEYPNRDTIWVEDLGRATRRYTFRGFVTGEDVFDKRDALNDAAEQPGPGTLVHPSLGTIPNATLIAYSAGERAEAGRVVEIEFAFVESGDVLFPSSVDSTQAAVNNSADNASASVGNDYSDTMTAPLATGQVIT